LISGRPRTIDIGSISGNLLIEDGADEIDVELVSGDLTIAGESLTDVDLESVSGKIRFEGGLATDADLSIESVSGDILVLVPAGSSARVDLSTFSGGLESDFGEMKVEKQKYIPSQDASFTIGGGHGARISVETFSGTISIKKR